MSDTQHAIYQLGLYDGRKLWKRIARRLLSKYRTKLALEQAAHNATKQCLITMVRELSSSIQGDLEAIEKKWEN